LRRSPGLQERAEGTEHFECAGLDCAGLGIKVSLICLFGKVHYNSFNKTRQVEQFIVRRV